MDHNPFISRNSDLIIMLIAGLAIHFASRFVFNLTVQDQFLLVLGFTFLSGLFIDSLSQSLEWALFFALGIQLVVVAPFAVTYLYYGQLPVDQIIDTLTASGRYSAFLLSSWLVGIPLGYSIQKLFMENYYRHRLF